MNRFLLTAALGLLAGTLAGYQRSVQMDASPVSSRGDAPTADKASTENRISAAADEPFLRLGQMLSQNTSTFLGGDDLLSRFREDPSVRSFLLADLARNNPERALRFVEGVSDRLEQLQLIGIVMEAWVGSDPDSALEAVRRSRGREFRKLALGSLLSSIVHVESAEVAADFTHRHGLSMWKLALVLDDWAEDSPEHAAQHFASIRGASPRHWVALSIGRAWGRKDPMSALKWALDVPSRSARSSVLKELADSWTESDPAAATSLFESLPPGSLRSGMTDSIPASWPASDLDGALSWAMGLPASSDKSAILSNIIGRVAESDPNAAIAKLEGLPEGTFKNDARGSVARAWGKRKPGQAVAWLETWPQGKQKDSMGRELAMHWALRDPTAAAAAFIESQVDGSLPSSFAVSVASIWAQSKPEVALDWLDELPSVDTKLRAATAAFKTWARDDAAAAANRAIASNVDDPLRSPSIRAIAGQWVNSDNEGASDWYESLNDAPARNAALTGFVDSLAYRQPEEIWPWAQQITAPELREESLKKIVTSWKRRDPLAAGRAVRSSSILTTAERNTLVDLLTVESNAR